VAVRHDEELRVSAAEPTGDSGPTGTPGATAPAGIIGRAVVWAVFGLLSAYVLWQSIGNLVSVVQSVGQFNDFVTSNGGAALARSVPWAWLVLDVLVAPVAFAVACVVTRRMAIGRTVAVFFVAFAAAGVVWLDLQLYVPSLLNL
jgi:amino acid permease